MRNEASSTCLQRVERAAVDHRCMRERAQEGVPEDLHASGDPSVNSAVHNEDSPNTPCTCAAHTAPATTWLARTSQLRDVRASVNKGAQMPHRNHVVVQDTVLAGHETEVDEVRGWPQHVVGNHRLHQLCLHPQGLAQSANGTVGQCSHGSMAPSLPCHNDIRMAHCDITSCTHRLLRQADPKACEVPLGEVGAARCSQNST